MRIGKKTLMTNLAIVTAALALTNACAQESEPAETMVAGLPRADDRPLEQIEGITSHYGAVEMSDGAILRTIITMPEDANGALHPLLFTQWVSCGSIEYSEGSESSEILARLARESGLSLIRVERSSDGDSQGPACDELDATP